LIPGPSSSVDVPVFLEEFNREVQDRNTCSMIVLADSFNVDPQGLLSPIFSKVDLFGTSDSFGVELEFVGAGISVFSTRVCVTERLAVRPSGVSHD
jgi:hypothetical protein